MKFEEAIFLKRDQKFSIRTGELSPLHEKHVLVRPLWVGICGSDLVAMELNLVDELSLGHEWVGEVIQAGEGVEQYKPGDMVTSTVLIKCGYCPSCLANKPDCDKQFFLSPDAGMLRTVADLPAASLIKLPSNVSHNTTLIEILAVAENVHTQLKPHLSRELDVLIIGAGSLGLSVALVLQQYGHKVELIEVIKSRIARAKELNLLCSHPGKMLLDPSKKNRYSMIIDASGDHLQGKGGWSYLEYFGAKHFMGVILAKYTKELSLKATFYFTKNATLKWIQGCTNESIKLAVQNWNSRIEELGRHMISHVYDYSQIDDAFIQAKDRETAGRVVIKVQDKSE